MGVPPMVCQISFVVVRQHLIMASVHFILDMNFQPAIAKLEFGGRNPDYHPDVWIPEAIDGADSVKGKQIQLVYMDYS